MQVVGVDGCKGGWLAVSYDIAARTLTPGVHATFAGVIQAHPEAACITVDIPIGLTMAAARGCDLEARRALTKLRGSSVFPAPDPRIVDAATYEEASARSRALNDKGISVQAFGIFPKIAEVNRLMTPELQARIVEVHPEICFWAMAKKRPMEHAKKTPAGFDERRALLIAALDCPIPTMWEAKNWVHGAGTDDVLDAIAAAWSARRFADGRGARMPNVPSKDARDLRMEMVY